MGASNPPLDSAPAGGLAAEWEVEGLVARLSRAAYDVALRHDPRRPFTDLELALWRELRAVFWSHGRGVAAGA